MTDPIRSLRRHPLNSQSVDAKTSGRDDAELYRQSKALLDRSRRVYRADMAAHRGRYGDTVDFPGFTEWLAAEKDSGRQWCSMEDAR